MRLARNEHRKDRASARIPACQPRQQLFAVSCGCGVEDPLGLRLGNASLLGQIAPEISQIQRARNQHAPVDQRRIVKCAVCPDVTIQVAVLGIPLHVQSDAVAEVVHLVTLIHRFRDDRLPARLADTGQWRELEGMPYQRIHASLAPAAVPEHPVQPCGQVALLTTRLEQVIRPQLESMQHVLQLPECRTVGHRKDACRITGFGKLVARQHLG